MLRAFSRALAPALLVVVSVSAADGPVIKFTDVKLKNFVGRGSGESVQMAFAGAGWVLVQPSEGRVVPTAQGSSGGGGLLGQLGG